MFCITNFWLDTVGELAVYEDLEARKVVGNQIFPTRNLGTRKWALGMFETSIMPAITFNRDMACGPGQFAKKNHTIILAEITEALAHKAGRKVTRASCNLFQFQIPWHSILSCITISVVCVKLREHFRKTVGINAEDSLNTDWEKKVIQCWSGLLCSIRMLWESKQLKSSWLRKRRMSSFVQKN